MPCRLATFGVALGLAAASFWPHVAVAAQFSAYPEALYKGPFKTPSFKGEQRRYSVFRTRLRESVKYGVAFGGHYAVAVIGCGTGCRTGYITDLKTGLIYDLPYGGEEYNLLLYRVRPGSRLLQTQWQPYGAEGTAKACVLEDFVWNGKVFKSLGRRYAAECPDWRDFA